jgi:uncharacterized protein (DUF2236 family)
MTELTSYLGWTIDYASPYGEPALQHPSSVQWRVYKNQVALAIGGIAAVLLEFADARIRSGVWDHSIYKLDPIGRSKRTGVAAMVGVYGPQSAARRVIHGVTNMHSRVGGTTPNGENYHALDPELLDWVAATAAYGFLNAYDRFVHVLSDEDKSRFYRDGSLTAQLYGAKNSPLSTADFMAMLETRLDRFEPHPIVHEFLAIIQSGKAAPGTPRFLHRAIARASVSLLPPSVRSRLELGAAYDLTFTDRLALRALAGFAERRPDRKSPACQASTRLGLPFDFLYRSEDDQRRLLAEIGLADPHKTEQPASTSKAIAF